MGILPVTRSQEETLKGEEYLNLYPYVDIETERNTADKQFWINKTADTYACLDGWAKGTEKIRSN